MPPYLHFISPVAPFNVMGVGNFISSLKSSLLGLQLQEQPVSTMNEKHPSIRLFLSLNSLLKYSFKVLICGIHTGPILPVSMAPWKAL